MKKLGGMLGVFIAMIIAVVPMFVNAAAGTIWGATDATLSETSETGSITIKKGGLTSAGTQTGFVLGVTATSGTISEFNAKITIDSQNFSFSRCRAESGWDVTCTPDSTNKVITVSVKATGAGATAKTAVATVLLNVADTAAPDETCTISLQKEDAKKCRIENGKYYDADGRETTKEAYEAACIENPTTGSFLPYAVILAGAGLAVVLYLVSRKNVYNL